MTTEINNMKAFDEKDFIFDNGYCPSCHSRNVQQIVDVYASDIYTFDVESGTYSYDYQTDTDSSGSGIYRCVDCHVTDEY